MIQLFKFMTRVSKLAVAAGFAIAAATAYAQNSIEAVNVSAQQGGSTLVKITLKGAPASTPASFVVNNPPRIAFDFPGTTNGSGKTTHEIGEGDVARARRPNHMHHRIQRGGGDRQFGAGIEMTQAAAQRAAIARLLMAHVGHGFG